MVPSVAPRLNVVELGNVPVVLRLIRPRAVVSAMRKRSKHADPLNVQKQSRRVIISISNSTQASSHCDFAVRKTPC